MTHWNIIAGLLIILFAGIIVGLQVYKKNKESTGKPMTMDEFLDAYGDNIIHALQSAIAVLSVNMDEFDTQEDYEAAIIRTTITELKENAKEFGLNSTVINLFDEDTLTTIIMNCFKKNTVQCFEDVSYKTIMAHTAIIDNSVVEKAANTESTTEETTIKE